MKNLFILIIFSVFFSFTYGKINELLNDFFEINIPSNDGLIKVDLKKSMPSKTNQNQGLKYEFSKIENNYPTRDKEKERTTKRGDGSDGSHANDELIDSNGILTDIFPDGYLNALTIMGIDSPLVTTFISTPWASSLENIAYTLSSNFVLHRPESGGHYLAPNSYYEEYINTDQEIRYRFYFNRFFVMGTNAYLSPGTSVPLDGTIIGNLLGENIVLPRVFGIPTFHLNNNGIFLTTTSGDTILWGYNFSTAINIAAQRALARLLANNSDNCNEEGQCAARYSLGSVPFQYELRLSFGFSTSGDLELRVWARKRGSVDNGDDDIGENGDDRVSANEKAIYEVAFTFNFAHPRRTLETFADGISEQYFSNISIKPENYISSNDANFLDDNIILMPENLQNCYLLDVDNNIFVFDTNNDKIRSQLHLGEIKKDNKLSLTNNGAILSENTSQSTRSLFVNNCITPESNDEHKLYLNNDCSISMHSKNNHKIWHLNDGSDGEEDIICEFPTSGQNSLRANQKLINYNAIPPSSTNELKYLLSSDGSKITIKVGENLKVIDKSQFNGNFETSPSFQNYIVN